MRGPTCTQLVEDLREAVDVRHERAVGPHVRSGGEHEQRVVLCELGQPSPVRTRPRSVGATGAHVTTCMSGRTYMRREPARRARAFKASARRAWPLSGSEARRPRHGLGRW